MIFADSPCRFINYPDLSLAVMIHLNQQHNSRLQIQLTVRLLLSFFDSGQEPFYLLRLHNPKLLGLRIDFLRIPQQNFHLL